MEKINIGDRVKCSESVGTFRHNINLSGKIICEGGACASRGWVVEFDIDIGGHDGSGFTEGIIGKPGHCWCVTESSLSLIMKKQIKVYGIVNFLESIERNK